MLALVTALGVGLWLSALNVKYRDVRYIVPFITQFWLFITPVWAVATRDPCLPTVLEAAARVRSSGAALIAAGDAADEVEGAGGDPRLREAAADRPRRQ